MQTSEYMESPTVANCRRLDVRLGRSQSMLLLLLMVVLMILAQIELSLARRPAKEVEIADEQPDEHAEGASRISGGFRVTTKPNYLATAWSGSESYAGRPPGTGRLLGNVVRLNRTHIIMHSATAADVFFNDSSTVFGLKLGDFVPKANTAYSPIQREQINFEPATEIDQVHGSGNQRWFEIQKATDQLIGRSPFRLYRLTPHDSLVELVKPFNVGLLSNFMESNMSELGTDCYVYGWSDSPNIYAESPTELSVHHKKSGPNMKTLVKVPVMETKCDVDGECELKTTDGSICRNFADRGSPVMCGKGDKQKLTYIVDGVYIVDAGRCTHDNLIYAFHTAELFPTLNFYSKYY